MLGVILRVICCRRERGKGVGLPIVDVHGGAGMGGWSVSHISSVGVRGLVVVLVLIVLLLVVLLVVLLLVISLLVVLLPIGPLLVTLLLVVFMLIVL